MDGTTNNMVWIVVVVVIVMVLYLIFKVGFKKAGDQIMGIITGQLSFADEQASQVREDKKQS